MEYNFIVLCAICLALFASVKSEKKEILIFGGNGFIGSATVDKILNLEDRDTMVLTIVNRGNWYWDSETRIQPHVDNVIHCDRDHGDLSKCSALDNYVQKVDKFAVVIDFSAYNGEFVKHSSQMLKFKVELYILISTDSVYDVCQKDHIGLSKEEDCKRPEDEEERKKFNLMYDYAHRKFSAEEAIIDQRLEEGGFNFVILRLPDVIGPRDTTSRLWILQTWAKLAKQIPEKPIKIPQFLEDYPMSLVYVDDVAEAIVGIFGAPAQVRDQVINLAWHDTFTTVDIHRAIDEILGIENDYIIDESQDNQFYMYPSVRKGPLSVDKAESLIGWTTTPWKEALRKTIEFNENAMVDEKYDTQKNELVQVVQTHLFVDIKNKFMKTLEQVYNINLSHFTDHDEL